MNHTILEFVGGAWDGMNLATFSPDPTETALASFVLRMTGHGRRGQSVTMPREYAVRTGCCEYVVTNHVAVGRESLVRLESKQTDYRETSDQPRKTIILQFVDGCLDGRTIRSDAESVHESLVATSCYRLTDCGTASAILTVNPCLCEPVRDRPCRAAGFVEYRVVERDERETVVTVILKHFQP